MPRKPLLILHCPAGGGHRAAAQALADRARARGIPAEVVDALSFVPPWFKRLYVDTHLRSSEHLPSIYGSAYFASNHRSRIDGPLRKRFGHWLTQPLLEAVLAADPGAIIATHFFPMLKLASARKLGILRAPVVEVVTDYAAHALWAEPGADAYCAPAGTPADDLVRHGIPRDRIVPTGIPVRAEFGAIPACLPGPKLRVLVTSGGFGVGPVSRVLESLSPIPKVALTVVCGENEELVTRISRLTQRLALDAEVVGFERDMPRRVAEADVVVTKPGGLTVSECLAAGRPLVLVGAVPGQETLNQQWVVARRAGVACEPQEVGATLDALRASELRTMAQRARELGAPDAADKVLDCVLDVAARAGASIETTASFADDDAAVRNRARSVAISPVS